MSNVGWLLAAAEPLTLPAIVGMIILVSGGMTTVATLIVKARDDKRVARKDYVDGSLASMKALSDLRQGELDRALKRIDELEAHEEASDHLAQLQQTELAACNARCAECLTQIELLKKRRAR